MRRAALVLAAALGAAGLLALLVGATHAPPGHRHPEPVQPMLVPVIVPLGDSTVTIECPVGYRLLNASVIGEVPGVSAVDLVLGNGGQSAVVTLRNSSSAVADVTLWGICAKARTGVAKDRKGHKHSHQLGDPDLETATVQLGPFTGSTVSVPCPAGSIATGGVVALPGGVELQASTPELVGTDGRWQFELFNADRAQTANVTLKAVCLPLWTERSRRSRHRHLLLFVTPRIIESPDVLPRRARRPLATEATFSVECGAGYRAVGGGWSIPEGFFGIRSESVDGTAYTLTLEATSELPTVELTALCLAGQTARSG